MEKSSGRATPGMIYALWAVVFANGVMRLWSPRASWRDIPFGILMVSGPVFGVVTTLLKRSPAVLRASRIALAAVWLGCTVAEIVGRHWTMGVVFLALGVLCGFLWREE